MLRIIKVMLCGLMFLSSASVIAETTVSLDQQRITSRVGSTLSVDIVMSGAPTSEGGGVNLRYDPQLVKVKSVSVDKTTWNFVNNDGVIDNSKGVVSGILFSSYNGVTGDAKIATVELEFVGKGKGGITLSQSEINPFAGNGQTLAVTFKPSKIRVRR